MLTLEDYQWLFRKSPTMATSIAEDGAYLDVNDAFLARLGYERDDMVGHRPEEFITAESAKRIAEELRPALRRTGRLRQKPISFVASNGDIVDCLTDAIIEYRPDGRFLRTIAVYVEATDQARANFKYRTLYRSMPAMLHTVDGNGLISTVTDHWLQKLGYTRQEVIGRSITDFFSRADQRLYAGDRLRRLIAEGDFENLERQMVTKSGEKLDVVSSAIAHRDAGGKVDRMLVASKDVTQRKRAESRLKQALAENARLR